MLFQPEPVFLCNGDVFGGSWLVLVVVVAVVSGATKIRQPFTNHDKLGGMNSTSSQLSIMLCLCSMFGTSDISTTMLKYCARIRVF